MKLDMDPSSSPIKSVFGIGIRTRKLNRYDLDDFAQSMTPNTNEEGRFFPNNQKVGKNQLCDSLSNDLKEIEKSAGNLTINSETKLSRKSSQSSFLVSQSGIVFNNQEQLSTQSPIGGPTVAEETPQQTNKLQRRRKSSLLEGSHLDREVLIRAFQNFGAPHQAETVTAPDVPKIEPINTEIRYRKTSAPPSLNPMMMEPHKSLTSYFFKGTGHLAVPEENRQLSKSQETLPPQPEMPEPAREKPKRRVYKKPTRLAELNMFCPPSM